MHSKNGRQNELGQIRFKLKRRLKACKWAPSLRLSLIPSIITITNPYPHPHPYPYPWPSLGILFLRHVMSNASAEFYDNCQQLASSDHAPAVTASLACMLKPAYLHVAPVNLGSKKHSFLPLRLTLCSARTFAVSVIWKKRGNLFKVSTLSPLPPATACQSQLANIYTLIVIVI